jgi:molecular chaperone IbpA
MNNHLTRWERYAPVSFGIEDMFKRLDTLADSASVNYPPYNILKLDDTSQELQIALAGFSKEDIEVSVERGVLAVSAKHTPGNVGEYVHKGIAMRNVNRNWQLGENTIVDEPKFIDGMLYITVRQEVPEEQRRRVLPIS